MTCNVPEPAMACVKSMIMEIEMRRSSTVGENDGAILSMESTGFLHVRRTRLR